MLALARAWRFESSSGHHPLISSRNGASLFYLAAGLACLMAVAFAGGRAGLAAAAAALAGFGYAFLVYRWWVPPAAGAAALMIGFPLARALHSSQWRLPVGTVGGALAAFAVFGPAEGLF